jgi:hypothetical protein
MPKTKTYLLCDDNNPDLYVGRITRTRAEVTPEIWALKVGESSRVFSYESLYFVRES